MLHFDKREGSYQAVVEADRRDGPRLERPRRVRGGSAFVQTDGAAHRPLHRSPTSDKLRTSCSAASDGHSPSLEAAAAAVRLRGLRLQSLLAERDAVPAVLLHGRARPSDRGRGDDLMVASVWDGIANFVAGMLVDRRQATIRYGPPDRVGAVPLGLSFVLIYMPPLVSGAGRCCERLRRATPVPHRLCRGQRALSGDDCADQPGRAATGRSLPGLRMLFGTAAAVIVALAPCPSDAGSPDRADAPAPISRRRSFFATVGAAILASGRGDLSRAARRSSARCPEASAPRLLSLARNRAFVTLNAAMMAMIVAITVLSKSVLYYFKYLLNDPAAGQLALASMGMVSGIAIPVVDAARARRRSATLCG